MASLFQVVSMYILYKALLYIYSFLTNQELLYEMEIKPSTPMKIYRRKFTLELVHPLSTLLTKPVCGQTNQNKHTVRPTEEQCNMNSDNSDKHRTIQTIRCTYCTKSITNFVICAFSCYNQFSNYEVTIFLILPVYRLRWLVPHPDPGSASGSWNCIRILDPEF